MKNEKQKKKIEIITKVEMQRSQSIVVTQVQGVKIEKQRRLQMFAAYI
jgi:hypothetical protein